MLAVYLDPTKFKGWWYESGDIYRHVWLNVADPVHVLRWGVYVVSNVHDVQSKPSADLTIETSVVNESAQRHRQHIFSETSVCFDLPAAPTRLSQAAAMLPVQESARRKPLNQASWRCSGC